ncbi:type II toxin-antitoxin system RelE/ParE family toxin [Patescibacteria group bacterium AH-259-L07]|nr:type II toxin-antitoxin system RelE/ParE family toxin [Patescibacteria group bacterium AH-259-L07]
MRIYIDKDVEKFITSLGKSTIAKVLRTIDLLELFGRQLGLPHSKKVRSDLFELRIRGQQEVRIFYAFQKGEIILLRGFIKKTQKTPQRELNTVIKKLQGLT